MENLQGEIWKPIIYNGIDYTGHYEVSNIGRVKSLKNSIFLKFGKNQKGYARVILTKNNKQKNAYIHRLVATCFIGEIKTGFVVDHINSKPLDNIASNLQIITKRQNCSKEKTLKSKLPCGIYICAQGKFKSFIRIFNEKIFLGRYENENAAANSYKLALFLHEQNKNVDYILEQIDKYRVSIGIEPVKRRRFNLNNEMNKQ